MKANKIPLCELEGRVIELYIDIPGLRVRTVGRVYWVRPSRVCWVGDVRLVDITELVPDERQAHLFYITKETFISE